MTAPVRGEVWGEGRLKSHRESQGKEEGGGDTGTVAEKSLEVEWGQRKDLLLRGQPLFLMALVFPILVLVGSGCVGLWPTDFFEGGAGAGWGGSHR